MLEELNPEHKQLIPVVRDEWIKRFNSLEFDKNLACEFVDFIYSLARLDRPDKIFLSSPLALQIAANILDKDGDKAQDGIKEKVRNEIGYNVGDKVRNNINKEIEDKIWAEIKDEVRDEIDREIESEVENIFNNKVWNEVISKVGKEVWNEVSSKVGKEVRDEVISKVGKEVRDEVWNEIRDEVWHEIRDEVISKVESNVKDEVWHEIRDEVISKVESNVKDEVISKVGKEVRDGVWHEIRDEVISKVGKEVRDGVWHEIKDEVISKVGKEVRDGIWHEIRDEVSSKVKSNVKDEVIKSFGRGKLKFYYFSIYGDSSDFGWISFYDYFTRIGIINNPKFNEYRKKAKCNLFIAVQLRGLCLVSRPPVFLNQDGKGRMHCTAGAAIVFGDGYSQHYVYGVYFSSGDFERAFINRLSGEEILMWKNTEQKAAIIRHYGYNMVVDSIKNKKVIDEYVRVSAVTGNLARYQLIEFDIAEGIPARYVAVECHSSHKRTFLGVPRIKETGTCMGAIAWTFGLDEKEYILEMET